MKLSVSLLLAVCVAASAETEERISKRFTVQPGGTLLVDVDWGSIDVKSHEAGEVAVEVAENAAFNLDAATAGGSVSSDLTVESIDDGKKTVRNRLKGPVNGGGKSVVLRSGGGSIQVKKE